MGKTKRGKGSKVMAISDASGFPIAVHVDSATPHEITLVAKTLAKRFTKAAPRRIVGDRAYDSDPLDTTLKERGIELISPHKSNRRKARNQDGRPLRRYRKRWKAERLYAWLQNFRRLVVRYEYLAVNFIALVHLACAVIKQAMMDALDPTAPADVRHDAEQFLNGDSWYEAWCETAGFQPTPLLSRRHS